MNQLILRKLLDKKITPDYFQLWGINVHWMSDDYNTPENRAIVADVIANYDTLEAAYLAEQQAIKDAELAKAQEIIDNLPSMEVITAAINNAFPDPKQNAFVKKLARVVFILARTD